MSENYLPFVLMVVFTVASPGPGVLMTLDNTLTVGWRSSMHGVLGLALGAAVMAGISSAGVGLLIRSSQPLFLLLKYLGIAYLFYLAYKSWNRVPNPLRASAATCSESSCPRDGNAGGNRSGAADIAVAGWRLVARGAVLQTSNPKSLLFFLSILPQVVDGQNDAGVPAMRLALAMATYCVALILIHALYAGLAARARNWLIHPDSARLVSRLSSIVFCSFGITMLTMKF